MNGWGCGYRDQWVGARRWMAVVVVVDMRLAGRVWRGKAATAMVG